MCLRGAPFYRARHENHGVGMADGYAWASGELAVATVTRGPGLMNAATAARTASQGGRKVLIITGDVATHMDVVDDYKYVDHGPIAAALGLEYVRVTRQEDASSGLARAVESASSGRTTLLSIAVDVLHAPLGSEASGEAPPAAAPAAPVEPSDADIAAIAEILSRSERPLLLAGQGAATAMARSALEALAERAGAWLGTTLPAKGLFSGSPYDVGVVGGFSSDPVAPLLADIDCVVALGASLHMHTTGTRTLFGDATVIQVDTDPEALGRRFPAQLRCSATRRSPPGDCWPNSPTPEAEHGSCTRQRCSSASANRSTPVRTRAPATAWTRAPWFVRSMSCSQRSARSYSTAGAS